MKITQEHWDELHQCALYKELLPRNQKIVDWVIREYLESSLKESIPVQIYSVVNQDCGTIKICKLHYDEVNQRNLLDLNALDFNIGLKFDNNHFMPFFGKDDIALFNVMYPIDEIENSDICLVKLKSEKKFFLATKEETGYFKLDSGFLGTDEEIEILGVLINVETK